jgi:hypothetical protein
LSHCFFYGALLLLALQSGALVIDLAATRNGDFDVDDAIFEVEGKRNDRQTLFLSGALQPLFSELLSPTFVQYRDHSQTIHELIELFF